MKYPNINLFEFIQERFGLDAGRGRKVRRRRVVEVSVAFENGDRITVTKPGWLPGDGEYPKPVRDDSEEP